MSYFLEGDETRDGFETAKDYIQWIIDAGNGAYSLDLLPTETKALAVALEELRDAYHVLSGQVTFSTTDIDAAMETFKKYLGDLA